MSRTSLATDNESRPLGETTLLIAIYSIAIYLVTILLYYAVTLTMHRTKYVNFFLGPGLALFYLSQYREYRQDDEVADKVNAASSEVSVSGRIRSALDESGLPVDHRTIDVSKLYPLIAVAAVACSVYIHLNFERIRLDVPLYGMNTGDLIIGTLLVLIVLHSTKAAFGWAIFLTAILSIGYGFVGPWMPGILFHTGIGSQQLIYIHVMSFGGVLGFITEIGVTFVAIFIIFAGMARSFGLLDYIMDIGQEFAHQFR